MGGIIARMISQPTRIVLASASPRRRRLLSWLGLPFDVLAVDTPESLDSPLASMPETLAISLAEEKAAAATELVAAAPDTNVSTVADESAGTLVMTFDTIVVLDGELLGKPIDETDAWRMLRALSGRTHQVITGCALSRLGGETAFETFTFAVTTDVLMADLDDRRIEKWMASGEYLGCAGAYNIEGQVAAVTGSECYQNVAGLPLCHLYAALTSGPASRWPGAPTPTSPLERCDEALCRNCLLGPRVIETALP